MRIGSRFHKAFSLTELIIVLVIIALLFSAMAPIITKRHIADTAATENIWNYVNNDIERNAYFDPGANDWTSSIYVGMNPIANYSQSGKLVVNSRNITVNGVTYPQPQLQFRFSPNGTELSSGIDAGSLLVDSGGNVHFGQIHNSIGNNNTVLGFSALANLASANNFVVVGTGALENAQIENDENPDIPITAVGTNAGAQLRLNGSSASDGIFIGGGSGIGYSASNIGLGFHSFYNPLGSDAHENIAIGTNSGIFRGDSSTYMGNILFNTGATTSGNMHYSTIIGYGAYNGGNLAGTSNDYLRYMTAIGYNSCNSIGFNKGLYTCIGYGSGAQINNTPEYRSDSGALDEHIFLGGVPQGGFAGRGVMEVHTYRNGDLTSQLDNSATDYIYATGADVVLNSNLVVRGKLYIKDGNNLVNYSFSDTYQQELEPPYYRCTSDLKREVLVSYNVYICTDTFTDDSIAHPKSINVLVRDGNAPNSVINSDERLKTNIVENNAGLKELLLLEPYNYTFKSDMLAIPQVGVIAQDLEKVFPASVSKDDKGFLKIRWDEMFYAWINSIKELSQKVEQIAKNISDLRQEIKTIKSKHRSISKTIAALDERIKKLERK